MQTYQTLNEILSQPEAWLDALQELSRQQATVRAFREQFQPGHLIFLGCGSPFFLARAAASLSRSMTGLLSEAHPSSDIWLFPEQTLVAGQSTALVVISRSGETTETLRAVETFRARGGQAVAAITCYDESTLAKAVQPTLLARAAQEIGLAQTRSFTSMFILTQGLIHSLGDKPLSARFRELPTLCRSLIDQYHEFARGFGSTMNTRFKRFFFLGGGAMYGLACEAMLKMKEMSLSPSEAFQMMEFRHGPMSMVNDETLIFGFVSEAATPYEIQVLSEMRQRGATVLAVTPTAMPADSADELVMLPGGLTDLERGALYLPVLHLIIYYHTIAKGLDPDLPNNLTAVVHLDDDFANKSRPI